MKTEVLMKYFQENCSHKGKISVSKSDLKKVVIANEQFTDEQWTQEKQRERGLRIAFWWEKMKKSCGVIKKEGYATLSWILKHLI